MTPTSLRSRSIKARRNQAKAAEKSAPPEAALQKDVVKTLRQYEDLGKLTFFAVMNEGKRSPKRQGWAKAMGLRAGVPDLVILIPPMVPLEGIRGATSQPRTIFLELKAGKNTLTDAQQDWANWLSDAKFTWAEIRSVQEVHDLLRGFLNGCRKIETEAA